MKRSAVSRQSLRGELDLRPPGPMPERTRRRHEQTRRERERTRSADETNPSELGAAFQNELGHRVGEDGATTRDAAGWGDMAGSATPEAGRGGPRRTRDGRPVRPRAVRRPGRW